MHRSLGKLHPILVGLALGLLTVAAFAQDQLPREYVVQSGDTCLDIVNRFPGLTLAELHRLNPQLGALPHNLVTGAHLVINDKARPDAILTFIRPKVETREPSATDWRVGISGEELYRQYRVATRDQATAEVTFADDSLVQLRENSLLVIYGDTAATAQKTKDKGGSELIEGSLRGGLKALREGAAPVTLHTPGAEVKASSRDLRLEVDKDKNSRLAVYDGKAQITAQGVSVDVPQGAGTVALFGKAPEPARPLPPSPTVTDPAMVTRLTFTDALARYDLTWKKVPDAAKYHVEAATDAKFNDLYMDRTLGPGVTSIAVENLRPGRHYLRLSTVDANGLQSYGALFQVAVVRVRVEGAQRRADGTFWAPRQAVVKTEPWVLPIDLTVNGRSADPARNAFSGGKHRLVIRASEPGFVAEKIDLEFTDVEVNAAVSPREVDAAGGPVLVTLSVKDVQNKRMSLEGAYIQLADSQKLPVQVLADGSMTATVTIPSSQAARIVPLQVFLAAETKPRTVLEVQQKGP